MTIDSFHLVTTKGTELRSRSVDQDLFLGDWCLTNSELLQQGQRYIRVPEKELDLQARDNQTLLVRELETKVLTVLSPTFNTLHSLDLSYHQWSIIIGPWLRQFLTTSYHRFMLIKNALETAHVTSFTTYLTSPISVTPIDTLQSAWMATDPVWSNNIDGLVLEVLSHHPTRYSVQRQVQPAPHSPRVVIDHSTSSAIRRSKLRQAIRGVLGQVMRLGMRSGDTVLIQTYLSRLALLQSFVYLHQFPVIPELLQLPQDAPISLGLDTDSRTLVVNALTDLGDEPFERFLSTIIPLQLPTNLIEDFKFIYAQVKLWPLPTKPKRVITANAFTYDDFFKVWLSQKISTGSEYVVLQHGNNYGTHRWFNPGVEELTADRFITWGWEDGHDKNVAGFIVKPTYKARQKRNPKVLLLSEYPSVFRRTIWDEDAEFRSYFTQQIEFVSSLNELPRGALVIRLHAESMRLDFGETELWRALDPQLRINEGSSPILELWANSRLVVHSYDSTGLLECLAANIPCIAFWQNGLQHTKDDCKTMYQLLVSAGIVHLSPESAAAHVNRHWDDTDAWWRSERTQEARREFAAVYARVSRNPGKDLVKLINQTK